MCIRISTGMCFFFKCTFTTRHTVALVSNQAFASHFSNTEVPIWVKLVTHLFVNFVNKNKLLCFFTGTVQLWELFGDICVTNIHTLCPHSARFRPCEDLILFGVSKNIITDKVIDLILLLSKFFIHRCNLQSSFPTWDHFQQLLKLKYNVQKQDCCPLREIWYIPTRLLFLYPATQVVALITTTRLLICFLSV